MRALDIIEQLHFSMPSITDVFSSQIAVTSLTMSATTVTCTTATAHNLSTGDLVNVQGALAPNPITSLTQVDNVATAITSFKHSIVLGFNFASKQPDDSLTVDISGATESEYNGVKQLLNRVSSTEFTYQISGDPSSPATGSPVLNEFRETGYNGLVSITVTGASTFTYSSPVNLPSPATGTITVHTPIRISGAVDFERAAASYTKQNVDELWAFVVLETSVVSKDRNVLSDADQSVGSGDDRRQRIIQNFSIFVFATVTDELSARAIRDLMEDVNVFLIKSIVGFQSESGLIEDPKFKVTFGEHGLAIYNGSVYAHRFQYQTLFDVTAGDTLRQGLYVPFRRIDLNFFDPIEEDGDDLIMTAGIELDE